jgi:AcrR family transcriptional regulator
MTSTTNGVRRVRRRLSREDWIDAALAALAEEGIEGVRIDRLCRDLGVTKGSFYHHFEGRDGLLIALANYWADTGPEEAAAVVGSWRGDPMQQLIEITRLVADRDIGRRDHAMRAWAAADQRAAHSVQRADRKILALLEKLLAELGVPADENYPLARVLFFTALGAHDAPTLFDGRSRRSLSKYLLSLVKDRAESAQR